MGRVLLGLRMLHLGFCSAIHTQCKLGVALLCTFQISVVLGFEFGPQFMAYVAERYGAEARQRAESWEALISSADTLSERQKLERVNVFFNRIGFRSDAEHWGVRDYWASPLELIGTHAGDCEDFSIAKYFTLRDMGVADERLRITYVRALRQRAAHMVLAYYSTPNADPLILDNLVGEIRPGSRRRDLIPVYSFNGDGLWRAKERGQGRRVGTASRLNLWRRLEDKMDLEEEAVRALSSYISSPSAMADS